MATQRKRGSGTSAIGAAQIADGNLKAAALLYEMAALQPNERSRFGYKRAAKAIAGLAVPVGDLVAAGTLREVPYVGPSSERIIREFVTTGSSSTVEAAIAKSGKAAEAAARRALRDGYLSHAILAQALEAPAEPGVVSKGHYRGDFQMHSTWSDGGESISVMARAAMDLGHTCLGITDHSYGLPIARGISMADAAKQWTEIDRLNARYEGRFRIFKGIEANILVDGTLDLPLDERLQFEFVVASPHSQLRRVDDQTPRMLAAVKAQGVAILGHPRGRMFNSRPGISADWDAVFEEAATREVAVELDGNWHRQDIDYLLAARALEAGCLFALDSDAHSIAELRFSDYAIAHARLAGIPAERVINCWTDEQLDEWMARRRARGGRLTARRSRTARPATPAGRRRAARPRR
ncbi:MAG TPA: DNA polymerase/3'-5' exonuclease PolX [Vicinamibacterales bacterium]|nr:DNA polymerase/3'-5' exonuclease PolX [Vicinamibacterales bacterium]